MISLHTTPKPFSAITIAFAVLLAPSCSKSGDGESEPNVSGSIARLDRTLERRADFDRQKRHNIDSIKALMADADGPQERYEAMRKLFQEYRTYSMDTTLLLARRCVAQAQAMNNDSLLWNARLMEAEGQKGMGDYNGPWQPLRPSPRAGAIPSAHISLTVMCQYTTR